MTSRRTELEIIYQGVNITEDVKQYVESFSYTDSEDASDSISLVLNNINWQWLNEWLPQLNDKIIPSIVKTDGNGRTETYKCGEFVVDDLSFSGRPLVCNINAVSSPVNECFTAQKKTKTWQSVTLSQIGAEIASASGISFELSADDVSIESKEQSNTTDSAFLKSLCDTYGYTLKTYSNKIVVIDPTKLETTGAVANFTESSFSSWNYTATIGGTYTGAKLSYTNTNGETFTAQIGDVATRCLELNESCSSNAEAIEICKGKVNKENRKAYTLKVTLREGAFISSTSVVSLSGMGSMNGNYYVTKVSHSLSNGYTVELEMRKIAEQIGETETVETNSTDGYPTLRYGNTDANSDGYVSIMQSLLVDKGYALPIFGIDGLFFSEVQSAVKSCQTDANITVDGVCGAETWNVLLN